MDYISDAFKKLNKPNKQKRFLKESVDDATTYGLNWPKWMLKEVENTIYPEKVTQETVNQWINRNFLDKVAEVLDTEANIVGCENLHFPELYTYDESTLWRTNERGITNVIIKFPKGTTTKIITKCLKDSGDLEEAIEWTAHEIERAFNYYVDYDDSDDYEESLRESVLKEDGFDDLNTAALLPDEESDEEPTSQPNPAIEDLSNWPKWAIDNTKKYFHEDSVKSVDEIKSWIVNSFLDSYYMDRGDTSFLEIPADKREKAINDIATIIVNTGEDEKAAVVAAAVYVEKFFKNLPKKPAHQKYTDSGAKTLKELVEFNGVTCGEFLDKFPDMVKSKFSCNNKLLERVLMALHYVYIVTKTGHEPDSLEDEALLPKSVRFATAILMVDIRKFD